MEYDLYRSDGSILFIDKTKLQNIDKKKTTVVASGFSYVSGFKQLNSSHVAVVDRNSHCIKMVNREDNSNIVFAGICGTSEFEDGASAMFNYPSRIELDKRNLDHLLVTDFSNNALRSVDVTSGNVSTIIRTGFNYPTGLAWYKRHLLVCNEQYISEVVWRSNGAATNNKLTTATALGYVDGDFSVAQFRSLHELDQVRDGLFLVADLNNNKLRLLNMSTRKVLPVCIGSSAVCTNGTTFSSSPVSVLISGKEVYVGGLRKIHKLIGKLLNLEDCSHKIMHVY